MHIVFLCNEYPPYQGGGIGTFTQAIARQLVKSNCFVTVLGLYHLLREVVEEDDGVRVIRVPVNLIPGINPFINTLRIQKRLASLNKFLPIDIVEGPENSFWSFYEKTPVVKVIRMHGGHHFFSITLGKKPKLARIVIEKLSFKKADHLCAVSNYVAEETRKLIKLGDQPIEIIPNPVDVNLFRPQPKIHEEPGLIIFVGTVCEKKGIRQLIDAMPEILSTIPDARLLVIGRDGKDIHTGENYRELLIRIIPNDIKDRIIFHGPVPHHELPSWLARAEVCVYPSHMEAQGIVVLEGMASGKAVVASETGPGPEIIETGINGLLCDPYNSHSIAEMVIRTLGDSELRRQLGINARKTTVEKYSLHRIVEHNLQFYKRCLSVID